MYVPPTTWSRVVARRGRKASKKKKRETQRPDGPNHSPTCALRTTYRERSKGDEKNSKSSNNSLTMEQVVSKLVLSIYIDRQ